MMNASLEPWQKDVINRLNAIEIGLKDIATVQACALLYTPQQISDLRGALESARENHRQAIDTMHACSAKIEAELGPQLRSREVAIKELGQEKADHIYADFDHAHKQAAQYHGSLRELEAKHPLIVQLSWLAVRAR